MAVRTPSVLAPLMAGACDNHSATPDDTTTAIQARLTTTTQPTPAQAAARTLSDRDKLAFRQVEQLKQQLGTTDSADAVTRQALLSKIQAAQDKYAAYLRVPAAAHVATRAVTTILLGAQHSARRCRPTT